MTIHLPNDVERDILAEVHSGHFASIDDALAEAWRSFRRHEPPPAPASGQGLIGALRDGSESPDPLLGLMKDHADLMDEIVEDAMRNREHQPWRLSNGE